MRKIIRSEIKIIMVQHKYNLKIKILKYRCIQIFTWNTKCVTIQITPRTVTKRSYRFRRDCQ